MAPLKFSMMTAHAEHGFYFLVIENLAILANDTGKVQTILPGRTTAYALFCQVIDGIDYFVPGLISANPVGKTAGILFNRRNTWRFCKIRA